ncbi:alpha-N-arabinofuranosidase [Halegenticoccus soli]|uniref:alpha-N-arabinofuranosidase n=1 Tax=Halegenticoccus soli TaxID=1985678 RepID=UPI00374489F7
MTEQIYVRETQPIGRIAPEIYGHFAEHLGRCIYGGIWAGEGSPLSTTDGLRDDTIELLAALDPSVLRWPGGCFAEDYCWEDGVGPRHDRPRRRNLWWAQGRPNETDGGVFEEPNEFGTDEFMRTCELLDAEPYLAANVGTGTAREAMNWVEYCNSDANTAYTRRRIENGHEEPYGVTYWGIGNETYGCGGNYDPDDYGRDYRTYATFIRGLERSGCVGNIELVACGFIEPDWNRRFMETVGGKSIFEHTTLIDHLSVHRYISTVRSTGFTTEQYYKSLARCADIEADIARLTETLAEFAPSSSIGIIVDEWGVWHPEATFQNGLEQAQTTRDALVAAACLDIFNTNADMVTMANLAQTVNVLQCVVQTDSEEAWPTQTYQVFDLYKDHMDSMAVRTTVNTGLHELVSPEQDLPYVSASASTHESDVFITFSNRHHDETRTVEIKTEATPNRASAEILFAGTAVDKVLTAANADSFTSEPIDVDVENEGIYLDVAPTSVVGLHVEI